MDRSSTEPLNSCQACGIAFPLGANFCPSCGVPLEHASAQVTAPVREALSSDPLIGRVIAERYRILQLLGRGGMGVVYRVEHVHIGKFMAMKLLSGELANDPAMLKRFEREAKAVSKLAHPNTVQIFDFGESAHLAYLVMEYVPGRDLHAIIVEQGALDFARVAKIGAQIAGSVEEAHQSGIIHRDIKPENVMILDTLEQHDFVKVLDFGIAKLRDVDEGGPATQKGHLIGTPYYMAPEQIRGDAFDHRVDIYALGALMYRALTGKMPFEGETPLEILGQHLTEPLVPPRARAPERDIPEEADHILSKALAKRAAHRYASMAALRSELLHYLQSIGVEAAPSQAVPRRRPETLATRSDVDRYERRVLRSSRFGKVAGALALCGAGYGAFLFATVPRVQRPRDIELEPNDVPSQANLLVPGQPIRAQLGKRRSKGEGDLDVYRIELSGSLGRVADIAVSALPNLDLALDLVEKGSSQPLLSVDSGELGEPERIPNFLLRGQTYYLRVREPLRAGAYPTENVSDTYTISLALRPEAPGFEREPNDSYEIAELLAPAASVRGLVGWRDDRDVYCLSPSAAAHVVELSGVPGVDLVLAHLDRRTGAGQRIDRRGVGEGEQVELPAAKTARELCFTVSAREHDGAAPAEPERNYEIRLR